jgi:hypothetical protein
VHTMMARSSSPIRGSFGTASALTKEPPVIETGDTMSSGYRMMATFYTKLSGQAQPRPGAG